MQRKTPVVITYHGSDLLGVVGANKRYTLGGRARSLAAQAAAFGAAQCIVVAGRLQRILWRKGAPVIPMGVDLKLFKPIPRAVARRLIGYPVDRPLVLFAAHPNDINKRFDLARAAVDRLQHDGMDVDLLAIYGRPHEEMPWYMNACDALALTSMHEASPCVVKEALACNLPVVSVDVGDVAERIGGVPGCYLCKSTPEDIAARLRLALCSGRPDGGRNRVQALDLPLIAHKVERVYVRAAGMAAA